MCPLLNHLNHYRYRAELHKDSFTVKITALIIVKCSEHNCFSKLVCYVAVKLNKFLIDILDYLVGKKLHLFRVL